MRVAVVGSRDYPSKALVQGFIRRLAERASSTVIVSGGARGPDRWAVDTARACGLRTVVFEADWETHGKKAGFLRNTTIVQHCDMVVAFWDLESRGTRDTLRKAIEAKRRVIVIGPDGSRVPITSIQ